MTGPVPILAVWTRRCGNRRRRNILETPECFVGLCGPSVCLGIGSSAQGLPSQGPAPQSITGVFLWAGRTGRVSNGPMFGAATKKTECATQDGAGGLIPRYRHERVNAKVTSEDATIRRPGRRIGCYGRGAQEWTNAVKPLDNPRDHCMSCLLFTKKEHNT